MWSSMANSCLLSTVARRLEGQISIITGGASGVGECMAKHYAKHGAKVIIADIQDELGHFIVNEIGNPTSASFIHCDVTKETDVKNVVDFAVSKYGKLDIMVNNAGIFGISGTSESWNIVDAQKAQFEEVLGVNLVGPFLGTKHAARAMIPAQQGSIITTASVASVLGGGPHAYAASKHGVVGLTRNAAVDLGRCGIRVNCLSPSLMATPLTRRALNIDQESIKKAYSNLKGSICEPIHAAEAAVYLGSDESKFVSGCNLLVDGGASITNAGFCMFN